MARFIRMQEDNGRYQYPMVEEGVDPTLSQGEFVEYFDPTTLEYVDELWGWGRWRSIVSAEDREFGIRQELFTELTKAQIERHKKKWGTAGA